MSNRRKLKKQISKSMALLYADCILYEVYVVNANKEAAEKVIVSIGKSHRDFLNRVSAREGAGVKGRIKVYFRKLHEDLKKEIDTISNEIAKLN